MDTFLSGLNAFIPNDWKIVFGIIALLVVATPKIVELRHSVLDYRMGKRQLELEKLRLEVLKLRLDVESAAKGRPTDLDSGLDALMLVAPAAQAPAAGEATPRRPTPAAIPAPPPPPERSGLDSWLRRHPRAGGILMMITQVVLGYFMIVMAFATVGVPIVIAAEGGKEDIGMVIFLVIFYALFAWLSYRGFVRARALRKELKALRVGASTP